MKPKPFLVLLCLNCLICVSLAVNPACECVVFQSYGRSEGVFTSPNFPEIYPSNVNCILYTFIADLDEIVELSFLGFDLQVPITNKCTDFLKFFLDLERPEVNERYQWNYEICGNLSMVQTKHYSSHRSLILEFHTDGIQANNTGFKGIFKFLDKAQFEIEGGSRRWGTDCSYDFQSNKNSKVGKFFSKNYPQNYPPGSNCQYVFYGEPNEIVKVTFQNIQLENIDGSCSDSPDVIVVRDGADASAPVISQYCNTRNGVQAISTGSHLYIEFMSDDKHQRQGFAATFEFVPANKLRPNDSSALPTKTTSSNSVTDCVHEYVSTGGKNGTFMSPRYPNPYPSQITCRYIFQGTGKERVQILFTDIDLYYPSGDPQEPQDCEEVDVVTVRVHIYDRPQDIGIYCGSKMPPLLMSNDNRIEVTFTSLSSSTVSKGFKAIYRFVTDFGITGEPEEDLACGFAYRSDNSPNGSFTSPNYPGLYPRETECHYLFYGKANERVHITFRYFEVEGIPPGCEDETSSDYVEFSNFNVELIDRKMQRSCGTEKDHISLDPISSDGNFFRVTFKSNEIYDARGFDAVFQFRKYEDPFSSSRNRKAEGSGPGIHNFALYYCTPFLLSASFITHLLLS